MARKSNRSRRQNTARAAEKLVNQLTGFTLSDYHLSTEVRSGGWSFLNQRSERLDLISPKKIAERAVIYVNAKELELFATHYLRHITSDFVLISGQMWSPPAPAGPVVDKILSHGGLLAWFSPNLEKSDLPIRPFPGGVALRGITNIVNAAIKHQSIPREDSVYVPHSAVHPHLEGDASATRKALQEYMAPPARHQDYLEQLARHRFVISPAGDRPDTYRHWESVAMGAIPVSKVPQPFENLFGDSMIYVNDLVKAVNGPFSSKRSEANRELSTVDYWRMVVDSARRGL